MAAAAAGAGVSTEEVKVEEVAPSGGGATNLKIHIGTWNVGNKMPLADFAPWLPAGGGDADIIVVGVQESAYKVKKAGEPDDPEDEEEDDDKADVATPAAADAPTPAAAAGGAGTAAGGAGKPAVKKESQKAKKAADQTGRVAVTSEDKLSEQHFFAMIQTFVGMEAFYTVGLINLLEMRLIVMARRTHRAHITDVEMYREATGIGGVWGNKGGLVVKLNAYGSTLCFVSCHLAAHQSVKHMAARNANVEEVVTEVRAGRVGKDVDLDSQFHHVFWLGDLNYRVDLEVVDGKKRGKEDHDSHWDAVNALVKAEAWDKLMAADQLQWQQREGKVFVGFKEGTYAFPPTFKVNRKAGEFDYKRQRINSYCDRVLWKSMPPRAGEVKLLELAAHKELGTSDHKPVSATFSVACTPPPALATTVPETELPVIRFNKIEAAGLIAMDPNGLSDPYVKFHAEPPTLFTDTPEVDRAAAGHCPATTMKQKTLSPKWAFGHGGAKSEIPLLRPRLVDASSLGMCSVILTFMDWDRLNADDPMGQAVLGLDTLARGAGKVSDLELPVLLGTVRRGTVKVSAELFWPSDPGYAEAATGGKVVDNRGCCTVM